jgi:hypothetical protein
MATPDLRATIVDGRLHLPAATYDAALAGCVAVAVLADDDRWWLLPLKAGAGGLQVKLRSAAGDRVVEVREFLRAQGIDDAAGPIDVRLRFVPPRGGYEMVPPGGCVTAPA